MTTVTGQEETRDDGSSPWSRAMISKLCCACSRPPVAATRVVSRPVLSSRVNIALAVWKGTTLSLFDVTKVPLDAKWWRWWPEFGENRDSIWRRNENLFKKKNFKFYFKLNYFWKIPAKNKFLVGEIAQSRGTQKFRILLQILF